MSLHDFIFLMRNIDVKVKSNWTCLHAACFEGATELVKYLIKLGLKPEDVTDNKENALHCAAIVNY